MDVATNRWLLMATGPGTRTSEGLTIEVEPTDKRGIFVVDWNGPAMRAIYKVKAEHALAAMQTIAAEFAKSPSEANPNLMEER